MCCAVSRGEERLRWDFCKTETDHEVKERQAQSGGFPDHDGDERRYRRTKYFRIFPYRMASSVSAAVVAFRDMQTTAAGGHRGSTWPNIALKSM
ncbi:hypothetical protein HBI56_195140 [Parastagonospora nodorum]|uniref:Uncharacterized protein n=1 Tax=Phaeosphaeria nodorum (strain SN15 / ATCC MYA-4574 / FGSC 10173) TaxID=321614 RepID=A0A7U2EWZ8_PHANO|nr:hypothetical protein HBH56_206820 [Parastagonospora nodorum]QRC94673.1 hypothetical protein JI435_148380 [Parastagonospora nodorum SN15]KAH3923739.1 hypothetical protein HBH54_205690 [Parastagonospora nodorum]KAH3942308.1 hypothetical protein HBH53_188680 [Parastagonospora nodorum]KAH3967214.1 hypothetical protein HBH52_190740 [Parastagonospora nodorum]